MNRRLSITATLLVAVLFASVPTYAGMDEGIDALKRNDFARAAKELRPLAEKGNAEAQYRVGLMYEYGKGFPQDKVQAVSWLRKSATQGHIQAQVEIAVILATGDGVAQDDKQAVDWFRKAAEQGNVIAQYNLGLLYAKGQGIARDDAQAIAWFRKSADQGYTGAQYKMGLAYEYGEGVPAKDPVRAYANYAIAAREGNQEYADHRDAIARKLSAAQLREAKAMVAASPFSQAVATAIRAARIESSRAGACRCTGCARLGQMLRHRHDGRREVHRDALRDLAVRRRAQRGDLVQRRCHRPGRSREFPDVFLRQRRQGWQAPDAGQDHVLSGRRCGDRSGGRQSSRSTSAPTMRNRRSPACSGSWKRRRTSRSKRWRARSSPAAR